MKSPKFDNGDIVYMDPCGGTRGQIGKIIGVVHYISGTFSYFVACASIGEQAIARHLVSEEELVLKSEADEK